MPFAELPNPEREIKNLVSALKHSTCLTTAGKITDFVERGPLSRINLGQVGSGIGAITDLGLIGHKLAKLSKAFATDDFSQIGAALVTATGYLVLTIGKVIGMCNSSGNTYARDNSTVALGNSITAAGLILEGVTGFSHDKLSLGTRIIGAGSSALTAGSSAENTKEAEKPNIGKNKTSFLKETKRFFKAAISTAKISIVSILKLGSISSEEVNKTLSDLKHFSDKFDKFTEYFTSNSPNHIKSFAPKFTYSLLAGSPSIALITEGAEKNDDLKCVLGGFLFLSYLCTTLKKSTSAMGFDVIPDKILQNSKQTLDVAIENITEAINNIKKHNIAIAPETSESQAYKIIMQMPIISATKDQVDLQYS